MAAGSHVGFGLGHVRHPRSAIASLSLILKFGFDLIYGLGNIAIFIFCRFGWKLPIHAHFWGVLGAYFPQIWPPHPFNPQKDHFCAVTRRLSHKAWKSVQRFDLGVGSRKKGKDRTGRDRTGQDGTGQDRTGQDSQKKSQCGNISPIWEKPPLYRLKPKLAWRVTLPT